MSNESGDDYRSRYEAYKAAFRSAVLALQAGDANGIVRHANEMLALTTDPHDWNYGKAIYDANQLLGMAALQRGDIAAAKDFLLAAGRTPGSPQMNSFGPSMDLAQELLARGERDVVIDFLHLVKVFWASDEDLDKPFTRRVVARHAEELRTWEEEIRAGGQPELNRVGSSFEIAVGDYRAPAPNTQIDDVIAERRLVAVSPSGERRHLLIEIGRPYLEDDGVTGACTSAVRGMDLYFPAKGEGTLQALGIAMSLPWSLLRQNIARGWKFYRTGDEGEQQREEETEEDESLTEEALDSLFGVYLP